MTRVIGVGVIGMGWMGEAHSRAYNAIADRFFDAPFRPRLVVCADAVASRAEAAASRFGFETHTVDWRAVIDHPDVEVVDVTAPNGLHLEVNRAVAAAGKHLACGALKWNMETMNQLQFQRRNAANPAEDGYTELLIGPAHPFHRSFNPAWGLTIGYDDTKAIEAFKFLGSVEPGVQGEPGFLQALAVARVRESIMRSRDPEQWEPVAYEE